MMETVPSVLMAFLNTPMKKVRDEEARQERAGGAGGLSDGGVFQATGKDRYNSCCGKTSRPHFLSVDGCVDEPSGAKK